MAWTLAQIAEHVEGEVIGDADFLVDNFATLQNAKSNQISFLSNNKYKKYLTATQAGAVIVDKALASEVPCNAIAVTNAYIAYAKAATLLNPQQEYQGGVHPTASVDKESIIDSSAFIGPQAVIESGVEIAQGVVVGPGCVVKSGVKIGKNTRLSANVSLWKVFLNLMYIDDSLQFLCILIWFYSENELMF